MKELSGKQLAHDIYTTIASAAEDFRRQGTIPTLAIVLATDDEVAAWYVRSISKAAAKVGIEARIVTLHAQASADELRSTLRQLADDTTVHGIILQTPLPPDVDGDELRALIPPHKDVDGANPLSAGRVVSGLKAFVPATAVAVMELLKAYDVPLDGARAVVVGRSRIVGMPATHLLLAANATVTVCHSHTKDLAAATKDADIIVAAAGKAKLIDKNHVKTGVTIIDVGTNIDEQGELVGDVDAAAVAPIAHALSPVPGGVGPVTTALLLRHTLMAVTHTMNSKEGTA